MKRRGIKIGLALLGIFTLLAFAFNGYPEVTPEDRTYIDSFLKEWKIPANTDSIHANFDSEVAFISQVQDSVIGDIRHDMIPFNRVGDLKCYFDQRMGSCYDRAIFFEKIFSEYGFPVRHIYLYFNEDGTPIKIFDITRKGLTSHAMLEVKTKKGWMTIGTNGNWLGIDQNDTPLTLTEIRSQLRNKTVNNKKKTTIGITFYESFKDPANFLVVYGLYSRHGEFLHSYPVETFMNRVGIKSFVPDYNLRMLLYNL